MAETTYNLTNIIKVTQDQYTTLKNGGTIGNHTYDSRVLYLVKDDPSYNVRRVTSADQFNGLKTEIFYYVTDRGDGSIYCIDIDDGRVDKIDIGCIGTGGVYETSIPSTTGINTYEELVDTFNTAIDDDPDSRVAFATTSYVDNSIATAITNTLNGSY